MNVRKISEKIMELGYYDNVQFQKVYKGLSIIIPNLKYEANILTYLDEIMRPYKLNLRRFWYNEYNRTLYLLYSKFK